MKLLVSTLPSLALACAGMFSNVETGLAQTASSKGQLKSTRPANAPASYGQRPQSNKPKTTIAALSSPSSSEVEQVFWGKMPGGSAWTDHAFIGQAGIGLFSPYYRGGYGISIPLFVAADYAVHDRFGVGGIVGFSSAHYRSRVYGSTYTYNRSAVTVAARGTYHLMIEDLKELDLYGGAMLGVNIVHESYPGYDEGNGRVYRQSDGFGRPVFGLFLGGRYYFTPALGAFAEIGASVAWLSGGLCYKFN